MPTLVLMLRAFAIGLWLGAAVLGLVGCGAPSLPSRQDGPAVSLEPAAELGAAPAVLRVRVKGADGVAPAALRLFSGELDSYHVGRIRAADLPSTLLERNVPAIAWTDRTDGSLVLAPSQPLEPGAAYSLAALGRGAVGRFVVTAEPGPYVSRVWPPVGASEGGRRWVFCGDGPLPSPGTAVVLEPAHVSAMVGAGADESGASDDDCFRLDLDALPGGVAVAPPLLGYVALDPSPVLLEAPGENDAGTRAGTPAPLTLGPVPGPGACAPDESPFGPACAVVMDDRIVVRNGPAPLLWTIELPTSSVVVSAASAERFVLRGLVPRQRVQLTGGAVALDGTESRFDVALEMAAPLPHVVLNEVLANPNGPDKTEEWVEFVNDGDASIALEGWSLEDSSGSVTLPRATLGPGAFALVVPAGYHATSAVDVPPAAGTLLVRVAELAGGGVANQGEALRLRDGAGVLASEFPAIAATRSGVSIARREAWSFDDDASAFGPSAPPGASPGSPNVLEQP